MKKALGVLSAVLVLMAASVQDSSAIDHGSLGVMSPKKTHIKKDFPPVAGQYPSQGVHAFALYNSWGCINYTYCNRHVVEVDVPEGYLESFKGTDIVSYGVKVTLTWPDPKGNDLDLFVGWAVESQSSGSPQGPCSTPVAEECSALHPEVFNIIEPKPEDDPETEEDESGIPTSIYMSVVNHSGVNTGYTLDLQWFLIPFGSFKEFVPPKDREISRPVTASKTPQPFNDGTRTRAAGDEGPKILIPGPDGKLIEQSLDFYEAGNRLTSPKTGTASWVYVVTITAAAISVLGFAFLVWRRRQREALS